MSIVTSSNPSRDCRRNLGIKSFHNPPQRQESTGQMKETRIGRDQAFIPHDQVAEMAEPRERALDDPPAPIAPQFPAILMRGVLVVAASRDNRLNPSTGQSSPQGIAVIPPIGDQPLGPLARPPRLPGPPDGDRVERRFEEGNLRWGSRLQVCSQRSTRAIDQNHPLCALAPLSLPDLGPPFLAGMKEPSAKHSSQRSFSWSLSWAKNARQSFKSTLVSSHCFSRRQHVLGLPYLRGNSLHWAPVQRIHRMPSRQRRSATRGRPPRGDNLGWGRWTRMASHCSRVRPRHAMCCLHVLLGHSWRYDTLTARF
jgi:hypothetical protein